MPSLSKSRSFPRSWISAAGVAVLLGGAIAAGAMLLAPAEALQVKPKPMIEYTRVVADGGADRAS